MNKRISQLLLLFLFSLFLSCGRKEYKNARLFSLKDIPENTHLTGEIIDMDEIFMPVKLFIKDSLLFTINNRHRFFVSVFNLHDMNKIGDFISFGSGPNEVLQISNMQFADSTIWAFDINRHQINKYKLSQFVVNQDVVPIEIIKMGELYQNTIISKDKLFTYSIRHIKSRFSIFDLHGDFLENKGSLPDTGADMTDLELFESFLCTMVLNPKDESIFMAYMNTDLIEIFDSNANLKNRMHGPDKFYPVRKEVSFGDMQKVRSIDGKTRCAYYNPVAFEDEIWTVYDGKFFDHTAEQGYLNNIVIVFDWEGNPIRRYTTDISFFSLAIDRENRIFYGITLNPDYCFVKFTY